MKIIVLILFLALSLSTLACNLPEGTTPCTPSQVAQLSGSGSTQVCQCVTRASGAEGSPDGASQCNADPRPGSNPTGSTAAGETGASGIGD